MAQRFGTAAMATIALSVSSGSLFLQGCKLPANDSSSQQSKDSPARGEDLNSDSRILVARDEAILPFGDTQSSIENPGFNIDAMRLPFAFSSTIREDKYLAFLQGVEKADFLDLQKPTLKGFVEQVIFTFEAPLKAASAGGLGKLKEELPTLPTRVKVGYTLDMSSQAPSVELIILGRKSEDDYRFAGSAIASEKADAEPKSEYPFRVAIDPTRFNPVFGDDFIELDNPSGAKTLQELLKKSEKIRAEYEKSRQKWLDAHMMQFVAGLAKSSSDRLAAKLEKDKRIGTAAQWKERGKTAGNEISDARIGTFSYKVCVKTNNSSGTAKIWDVSQQGVDACKEAATNSGVVQELRWAFQSTCEWTIGCRCREQSNCR